MASELATQAKTLDDVNDLLNILVKGALERMLDTEMDIHLGRKTSAALQFNELPVGRQASANRRNGRL